jgi:diguanylate cyclase (GGDEF)-like protein
MNSNIGTEHEVRQLRNMIYSYLAMLASDILWALMEDGIIHLPLLLNAFINSIVIVSISCGCYFWFRFIEDRVHFSVARRKNLDALLILPLLIACALDFLSVFTGWVFYIDAQGHYQSKPFFDVCGVLNYFYLIVPTVYSSYRAVRTASRQERSEYCTYALYMIAPLISGLLEETFPHVPLLALNIFLMILILFLMIQNNQIYNDALTGLNNRRRLNQYLEASLTRVTPEHPALFFIMDINCFKSINDIYGHLEGDNALKFYAGVLKEIAARYSAFVARYGGDEFCMVVDAGKNTPEEIVADINRSLEDAQTGKSETGAGYTLSVSTGYTVCNGSESGPEAVLAKADALLYENKRAWHGDR